MKLVDEIEASKKGKGKIREEMLFRRWASNKQQLATAEEGPQLVVEEPL